MRPSKEDFIRQQGFTTGSCHGLYSALMFQPRVIAVLVIAGVILQSAWLFLALSTVLWWSVLVPRRNVFDAFFNHVIAVPMRLTAVRATPAPRRFSQAMAGTFALSIAMTLFSGAPRAAWLLEGVFITASMSVVVRRFCVPAFIFHLLWPGAPAMPCPSADVELSPAAR